MQVPLAMPTKRRNGNQSLVWRPFKPKKQARNENLIIKPQSIFPEQLIWMPKMNEKQGAEQIEASKLEISPLDPELEEWIKDNLQELDQGAIAHFMGHQPIILSHLGMRLWGKGKAENAVTESIANDVDRRMAGYLNMALKMFVEEKHGIKMVAPLVQQQIRTGLVRLLIFDGDATINKRIQREKGITIKDIYSALQRAMFAEDLSPEKAALRVFESFEISKEEAKHAQVYLRNRLPFALSRISHKANRLNPIVKNLKSVAREVYILTHAWKMSNLLATKGEEAAEKYRKSVKGCFVRQELKALLKEEIKDFNDFLNLKTRVNKMQEQARALRAEAKNIRWSNKRFSKRRALRKEREADKIEFQAREILRTTYHGEKSEFASRYRGAKARPMFAKPAEPRNFKEVMTTLVTTGELPYYYNENGFLRKESPQLLKVAEIVDRVAKEIPLEIGPVKFYRDLDEAKGDAILGYRDTLASKVKDRLGEIVAAEKDKDIPKEEKIRNIADRNLFPLGPLFDGGTVIYMLFDTDNITYEEFMHGLTYAEPEYGGMLRNTVDVLHRCANYKQIFKNMLVWIQAMRDGRTQNALGASRSNQGIVPHQVKNRGELAVAAATFLGFGGIASVESAFWTLSSETIINPQKTDWRGRRMLEKIPYLFGPNFQDNPDKLVNQLAKAFGRKDFWDMSMFAERVLRIGTFGTAAFLGVHALAKLLSNGDLDIDTQIAEDALRYFGLPWIAGKSLALAFGRDYKFNQVVNVPRFYEFDPSEDLLYTVFCLVRGITVSWDGGHFQQNDSTVSWPRDMNQKFRWQAQNARLLRYMLKMALKYRRTLNFHAVFDMLAPCMYNNWGTAMHFNRLGIWGFVFGGLAPMLMLNNILHAFPGQDLLGWVVELALINYALVEMGIRFSNLREGVCWRASTLNFGYERAYAAFNLEHTMRRLFSNESAPFNVTGAITFPMMMLPWGIEVDTGPYYWRQNFLHAGINLLAMSQVMSLTVARDGAVGQDPLSLAAWPILVWLFLDAYYSLRGTINLNDGIQPDEIINPHLSNEATRRESAVFEQARNNILLWGPNGEIVKEMEG